MLHRVMFLELAAVFPVLVVNVVFQPLDAELGGVRGVTGVTGSLDPAVRQGFLTSKSLTNVGKWKMEGEFLEVLGLQHSTAN